MTNGLTRWDPFEEMRSLQKQFFNDDWFGAPLKTLTLPTTDVYTSDDKELVVEAHMPNFEDKDIDVHVENGALVIRAEKHEKEEDKKKKYVVRESSSSFYRRIHLPKHADQEKIEAEMKDGVLKVVVPFKELPKPKKITIKSGKK
ncbi:Hsp20/alpha crystallin family protein [Candidatus Saccharibacteria bacterium]|nr:Hsp20/alpha crystallin family protein [Candidatus Saccharibacteria bacterium]